MPVLLPVTRLKYNFALLFLAKVLLLSVNYKIIKTNIFADFLENRKKIILSLAVCSKKLLKGQKLTSSRVCHRVIKSNQSF